ncbi:MAG TPA: ChaN family lipoprotein [Terriglobales bacterium]|nr:ChaN family lipoprotein [Terriglobales bacterium]
MATTSTLGSRRNAAQLRALAGVERELRANDSSGRRKYLRDFRDAFRSYQSIIDSQQLASMVHAADIILVGDYHALPAAQRYAANLLEQRAQPGDRPVVLGVESIFSRHQHVLEEWWRREIDEAELRERVRFDFDWGYDWAPFYELLVTAREHGDAIYGLDCMPREDLRKIGARDRHAVDKIEEIRQKHANAVILVLFGESHFAPRHLPRLLRGRIPGQRLLTVLQNVDALYWSASAEPQDRVEAVRVSDHVVCVFNSTPLEKYESYRLHLTRWSREDANQPDAAPTVYNLIDSLACFLDINRYSSHNTSQPKFLVDLLPEVYCGSSDARLQQLLLRAFHEPKKVESMLQKVEAQGSVYLPSINALYVREFQMMYTAEEVARFLHHACRGLPLRRNGNVGLVTGEQKDRFYARTVENALAYFGSRVLYPARPAMGLRGQSLSPRLCEKLAQEATSGERKKFDDIAQQLGSRLGSELYDAYLRGSVSRTILRHLFLAHIEQPGGARQVCREIIRRAGSSRRKPCGSVR